MQPWKKNPMYNGLSNHNKKIFKKYATSIDTMTGVRPKGQDIGLLKVDSDMNPLVITALCLYYGNNHRLLLETQNINDGKDLYLVIMPLEARVDFDSVPVGVEIAPILRTERVFISGSRGEHVC